MNKKIIIGLVATLLIIVGAYIYQSGFLNKGEKTENPENISGDSFNEEELTAEEKCLDSGGEVSSGLCCKEANDFPNTCSIGACGCSEDNSELKLVCDCEDGCFDGEKCTKQDNGL